MARTLAVVAVIAVVTASNRTAAAYEFEVRARSIGQGHQLRSIRFEGEDLRLDRRRFTQSLILNIWDLTGRLKQLKLHDARQPSGPEIYFTGYLRVDHDFGDFTAGQLRLDNRIYDAVDVIPELEEGSLQLDLLYGYLAAEGLAGGWLDVTAGRQLEVDTLDWFSMDGVTVRANTGVRLAVEAFGGARVRESSFGGASTWEPDGTSAGLCQEYVEGATPGSGAWRPIDRDIVRGDNPFRNDFDFCPQRQQWMPTFGGAVEAIDIPWLYARVAYRRSVSPTPELIGPADRGDYPDVGLYPNELGQEPGWGVNEERLSATARAPLRWRDGRVRFIPYAAFRYSLLHAAVDEAHAGGRVVVGAHALEPEVFYSLPTFDGDSIFNVFSVEPYTDVRLTYQLSPRSVSWSGYGRLWGRRYLTEDSGTAAPGAAVDRQELGGGAQLGARYRHRQLLGRLDLFHEGGYGGRRTGGYSLTSWQMTSDLAVSTRLSVIDFEEDLLASLRAVSLGAQLGATYLINEGMAFSLVAEENSNRLHRTQTSVFGILDLNFHPEGTW